MFIYTYMYISTCYDQSWHDLLKNDLPSRVCDVYKELNTYIYVYVDIYLNIDTYIYMYVCVYICIYI